MVAALIKFPSCGDAACLIRTAANHRFVAKAISRSPTLEKPFAVPIHRVKVS
jgi:hypothetical protein